LKRTAITMIASSRDNLRFKWDTYSSHILLKEPERLITRPIQHVDEMHTRLVRTANVLLRGFGEELRIKERSVVFQRPMENVERLKRCLIQSYLDLNMFFKLKFHTFKDRSYVYSRTILRNSPGKMIAQMGEERKNILSLMAQNMNNIHRFQHKSVKNLSVLLRSLSPYRVLDRGYAVVLGADERVISDARETEIGEMVEVRFRASRLKAEVKEKEDCEDERNIEGG